MVKVASKLYSRKLFLFKFNVLPGIFLTESKNPYIGDYFYKNYYFLKYIHTYAIEIHLLKLFLVLRYTYDKF